MSQGANQREVTAFDKEVLNELVLAYDAARAAGKESFIFHGQEILVSYAGYLIEYLEGRFK